MQNSNYEIEGCLHYDPNKNSLFNNNNYFVGFKNGLEIFKQQILNQFNNNENKVYIHFGDGDYYFLKNVPLGSATPGKRALSISYDKFNIQPFREGWVKSDYHCVEYLERGMIQKLQELYPGQKTLPTEYLYGLIMNKWFLKTFKGHIGLIGAGPKLDLIKKLMEHEEYQEYLGLDKFNDYIKIPQKFACDNLDNTINMVSEQLKNSNSETKVFLFGVGHVKSGLMHHLPRVKNAIYIDVGAGIDGLAGLIDHGRPYAKSWINYHLSDYDYGNMDLLAYNFNNDKTKKMIS